jgi:hypothetical protein
MRKLTRRALTGATGALVAVGALTALSAPAHAAPSGCTGTWGGGRTFTATCTEGDGLYRAKVTCVRFNQIPTRITATGPWVAAGPGTKSTATCPLYSYTSSGSIEFA